VFENTSMTRGSTNRVGSLVFVVISLLATGADAQNKPHPRLHNSGAERAVAFPRYPKPEKGKKNLRNYGRQNRDTISEILYGEERREFFSFLDENDIGGVFILAADRHRSDARVIERESGYPLYEFMSSRLTNQIRHGHQGRGTIFSYNEKCSFGKVTFDLSLDDPTATYEVVTIDNETVHSFTLKRSQLQ